MYLARVFQDGMVLQRRMPILIWGYQTEEREIVVKINGKLICKVHVQKGAFSFFLPKQEAMEDVTLEIGNQKLRHVDIGEVWVAGGQSNMEFMLQYTADSESEIVSADDIHLRTYIVGQYSYKGEREEGVKSGNAWDKWLNYCPSEAGKMPAAAIYFAKEIRKQGIPVGILSCNWGGTSASAWLDKKFLMADDELKSYIDDFEESSAKLDMKKYLENRTFLRHLWEHPLGKKISGIMLKHTFAPGEVEKVVLDELEQEQELCDAKKLKKVYGALMGELSVLGPGESNEPAALYENMLQEIAGYSVRGVLWYQGESDYYRASLYTKLFQALVESWRNLWKEKNSFVTSLPFLTVQLAPFGFMKGADGLQYPQIREQQYRAEKNIEQVYMASISDIGNIYDVHPKEKRLVGKRLARLAEKYVYKLDVLADAPEAVCVRKKDDLLVVDFQYGEGLYLKKKTTDQYNGYSVLDISEEWLPPVLDGVNGLRILVQSGQKEQILKEAHCTIDENCLIVSDKAINDADEICIEFAQTAFYEVNLYNQAGLPAKPFRIVWRVQ